MKKNILITLLAALLLSSCGEYNKLLKSTDYEYKYEQKAKITCKRLDNRVTLLNELIAILKGTDKAEESLYMLNTYTIPKVVRLRPRLSFNTTTFIPAAHSLNWHVFIFDDTPEPRLDNPARIAPSSSCRCLWNTSHKLQAKRSAEHDICLAGQAGDEGVSVCKTLL